MKPAPKPTKKPKPKKQSQGLLPNLLLKKSIRNRLETSRITCQSLLAGALWFFLTEESEKPKVAFCCPDKLWNASN